MSGITQLCPACGRPPRRLRSDVVDATGTRRRLEALAVLGHSAVAIGARMGRPPGSSRALVSSWRSREREYIDARTADDVKRVYAQLSQRRGQCDVARIRALQSGCLPPEAWAQVDIDDPNAQPLLIMGAAS